MAWFMGIWSRKRLPPHAILVEMDRLASSRFLKIAAPFGVRVVILLGLVVEELICWGFLMLGIQFGMD